MASKKAQEQAQQAQEQAQQAQQQAQQAQDQGQQDQQQAVAEGAAQGAAAGATQGNEQGGEQGEAGEAGDGEPAHSRGDAKKSVASPKAPAAKKATGQRVTPAVLAARQALIFDAPAISAVMHEKHLGIVNHQGEDVDLDKVLVRDTPTGTNYRATERIYEASTPPGGEQRSRRRLLFGQNALVSEAQHRELVEAVAQRAAASKDDPGEK